MSRITSDTNRGQGFQELEMTRTSCGQPCDPNAPCDECADYWNRMVDAGYWNVEHHRWTDKGWREITK